MANFNLKKEHRRVKKTSMISIRIKPDNRDWIKQKNLSPTKIFDNALSKLKKRKKW